MPDDEVPGEVRRLIDRALASIDHVEVVLHLHRSQDTPLTADQLSAETHFDATHLARVLRDLSDGGLVAADGGRYRSIGTARDRAALDLVAQMYNSRPVTLVRAIYARSSPIKTFADAFRLRKDD